MLPKAINTVTPDWSNNYERQTGVGMATQCSSWVAPDLKAHVTRCEGGLYYCIPFRRGEVGKHGGIEIRERNKFLE